MPSHAAKGLSSAGEYQSKTGTSLQDATAITRCAESSKEFRYEVSIPSDWCFGPVAHGGYLSSLLSRAVAQHVQMLSSSAAQAVPDTLSSCTIAYLAPVVPGSAQIRIENRFLSKHSCHFVAALYQQDIKPGTSSDDESSWSLRAEGTVFMTNARTMGMSFYKYKPGWECYFRPESIDRAKMLNKHPEHGPAVFDVWWKLDDEITIHELGLIADLIGPILFNYEDARATHWISTRNMNVDVVRLPPSGRSGWKWLFCRMELIENVGDRFYCDVTMTDEAENVVGIARQSCVARPFDLVGKSSGKKNKTKSSHSKI